MVVQIVLGSRSDIEIANKASALLEKLGVQHRVTIASAHRTPSLVESIAKQEDVDVFIAIAGLAAALPGAIAANTTRPVIGVPVSGKLSIDAVLSIVQMPKGVPVAAVGIDSGENAALLAAQIVSLRDAEIARAIERYRQEMRESITRDNEELKGADVRP